MKEPFTITEKDLYDMAESVIKTLASESSGRAKVLFLEGDLGAGKTTFAKELASVLGVLKEDVHSPTFILKKEYKTEHPIFRKLVHIDAYRFNEPQEAKVLRLDKDREEEGTLLVVEWPSKLGGTLDEDMTLAFSVVDDETREVVINYVSKYAQV
jgi:tRNA threonylcarbamoyladenosine biosynthesis protein TsaE